MRVLIVTGNFAGENQNPWLLDDLALQFARSGDEVDVIVHDTKNARARGSQDRHVDGIRVTSVGPTRVRAGRLGKILNHVEAGWGLHTIGFRSARTSPYDLCVYTSIGAFSWGLPARLRRAGLVKRSVFVLWDFFPIHQLEIGRIAANWLHAPLRGLESLSMRNADAIAVMSPANERFLRTYHRDVRGETILVPPWASDPFSGGIVRSGTKRERFTAIFGGQLVAGRGLDTLLRAAKRLQDSACPVDILIVGDGSARVSLIALAQELGLTNTTFLAGLPREEYRELLRSSHIGIAVTVAGVSPPTFPSKIVEYCASGVPMVVCVEPASDAGSIVEAAGAGLSARAGDDASLATAIKELHAEEAAGILEARARRARDFFEAELSVSRAVETIRAVALTT